MEPEYELPVDLEDGVAAEAGVAVEEASVAEEATAGAVASILAVASDAAVAATAEPVPLPRLRLQPLPTVAAGDAKALFPGCLLD